MANESCYSAPIAKVIEIDYKASLMVISDYEYEGEGGFGGETTPTE